MCYQYIPLPTKWTSLDRQTHVLVHRAQAPDNHSGFHLTFVQDIVARRGEGAPQTFGFDTFAQKIRLSAAIKAIVFVPAHTRTVTNLYGGTGVGTARFAPWNQPRATGKGLGEPVHNWWGQTVRWEGRTQTLSGEPSDTHHPRFCGKLCNHRTIVSQFFCPWLCTARF